jgi:NTP pyrophosphatase (non-canonical NTP hydrolase)
MSCLHQFGTSYKQPSTEFFPQLCVSCGKQGIYLVRRFDDIGFAPYHPESLMAKRQPHHTGQFIMFPGPASDATVRTATTPEVVSYAAGIIHRSVDRLPSIACEVVLSGSYRKDFEQLRRTYEELKDLGCSVLSPSNVNAVSEVNGFVYMQGEETQAPEKIEQRHFNAIQNSRFVWLHAPGGYVGPTAALEVGFAHAIGIPVFARNEVTDKILREFVKVVDSPATVVSKAESNELPMPVPAVQSFQKYYQRAAMQRGYSKESAKDTLLLMVEEVGELARAVRKKENLVRHSGTASESESHELADVFIYVIHMANVLGLDLGKAVQEKECLNLSKFLHQSLK